MKQSKNRNRSAKQRLLSDPLTQKLSEKQETLRGLDETLPVTLRLPKKTMTPQIALAAGRISIEQPVLEAFEA